MKKNYAKNLILDVFNFMLIKRLTLATICSYFIIGNSSFLFATNYDWVAQDPNNNLNTTTNWNPTGDPAAGSIASFNSNLANIAFNPRAVSSFTTQTFNFPYNASSFLFTIMNSSLIFNGTTTGITGIG